jgi:hypothetical protein
VREAPAFRARVAGLPSKYRSAILAAEVATRMVYRRPLEPDFGAALRDYLLQMFPAPTNGAPAAESGPARHGEQP